MKGQSQPGGAPIDDLSQRQSYEGYLSQSRRQREHNERIGLENINKRAMKQEQKYFEGFATHEINPMNNMVVRYSKLLSYVALESFHNTIFHFIETVKVRGQARNIVSGDHSHYFKNQVEKKPLISGIVSGFLGAAVGAATFMTVHDFLTLQFYCNTYGRSSGAVSPMIENSWLLNTIQAWDFKRKNILIYATSDFFASFTKIQFEVRKQLIQMYTRDSSIAQLAKASSICWFPLMLRDVGFRTLVLSFYYATTEVQHKPI